MDALQASSRALVAQSILLRTSSMRLRETSEHLRQRSRFAIRSSDARFSKSNDLLTISRFQRHLLFDRCSRPTPRPRLIT
jgi:hypothetical protein